MDLRSWSEYLVNQYANINYIINMPIIVFLDEFFGNYFYIHFVKTFMIYCKNCDMIQPFLSHCISEIRLDTAKAREASFRLSIAAWYCHQEFHRCLNYEIANLSI